MYGSLVSRGTRRPATVAPTSFHVAPPSVDLEMLAPNPTAAPLPGVVEKYRLPSGDEPIVGSNVFSATECAVPVSVHSPATTTSAETCSHTGGTSAPAEAAWNTLPATPATRVRAT